MKGKTDRASSKMHFKGIIWGGVGEEFEICFRKNKSSIYLVLTNKKKCSGQRHLRGLELTRSNHIIIPTYLLKFNTLFILVRTIL